MLAGIKTFLKRSVSLQRGILLRFPELSIAILMFLVTSILASYLGTRLVIPDGRISYYLGFRYAVPIALATIYFSLPLIIFWIKGGKDPLPVIWLEVGRNSLFLVCFVVVMWAHFHIKMWVPLINPHRFDDLYQRIDELALPVINTLVLIRASVASYLFEVDWWYMWAFIGMFFASFTYHCAVNRNYFRHLLTATLLNQSLGAFSYLLVPAIGPFIYVEGKNAIASLQQTGMWAAYNQFTVNGVSWLNENSVSYFNAGLAAMPSLHAGASWVFLWYACKSRTILAPLYVILFAWIGIEAVVSKWHYLIDIPAGMLLAAISIWVSNMICRSSIREQSIFPNEKLNKGGFK